MQSGAYDPRAERYAALLSLFVGVLLLGVKTVAYLLTGSAAIFSEALESIVNVCASGFALYAIIVAHHPADADHPYGHGKIEFIAAAFEGGMIVFAALLIGARGIRDLIVGSTIQNVERGLWLLAAALIVNAVVGMYLVRAGRRGGSITLEADGKHLLSDAVSSVAVLAALCLFHFTGWRWLDPAAALLVAVYIAVLGAGLIRRSAAGLMDKQDAHDEAVIRAILDAHLPGAASKPHICSYHKLRHRHSGRYHWVDFHLVVPAKLDVAEGHQIASAIEYEIEKGIGEGNATAHIEPCIDASCVVCDPARLPEIRNPKPEARIKHE